MKLRPWVKLPAEWIEEGGLRKFRWRADKGPAGVAGLMVLAVIAQHADEEHGIAARTYDDFARATGLSRTSISRGLSALEDRKIISCGIAGRSSYQLEGFNSQQRWGKLPARALYSRDGELRAFHQFHLRQPAELDALKLYFAFVARRNWTTNLVNLSYDSIEEYTGVRRTRIRTALDLLMIRELAHVERVRSTQNDVGVANAYRLVGLDTYTHMGTRGRAELEPETALPE